MDSNELSCAKTALPLTAFSWKLFSAAMMAAFSRVISSTNTPKKKGGPKAPARAEGRGRRLGFGSSPELLSGSFPGLDRNRQRGGAKSPPLCQGYKSKGLQFFLRRLQSSKSCAGSLYDILFQVDLSHGCTY